LVVLKNPTRIHSVINGWDIVNWCHSHRHRLPKDLLNRRADSLEFCKENFLHGDNTVLDAIKYLHQERVNGVGVLNNNNERKLIGNFGPSDMKFLMFHHKTFTNLYIPLREYFGGRTQQLRKHYKPACKLVTCRPDTPFKHILRHLVDNRAKRIYITDNNERVVGIVTPADILLAVWNIVQERCDVAEITQFERLGVKGDEEKVHKRAETEKFAGKKTEPIGTARGVPQETR